MSRPTREPEVAHAVGQAEVDHLGHRALVGRDRRAAPCGARGRRLAVDVGASLERLAQVHVARDVGEDAQLDLAVVGREQDEVVDRRPRTRADAPARARCGWGCSGGSGRSTRAARSTPRPGGRSCAAGPCAGRAAPAARRRTSTSASCRAASRAASGSSGGPRAAPRAPCASVEKPVFVRSPARQVELVEEDLLELLGAAEVELVADRGVDVLLESGDLLAERRPRARPSASRSMATPVASMSARTGIERQLELVEDAAQARLAVEAPLRAPRGGRADRGGLDGGLRLRRRARRAGGSSISSRSALMSCSDWLRSAALRMYAATCVSNATRREAAAGGAQRLVAAAGSRRASSQTRSGLTSWPTSGRPEREDGAGELGGGLARPRRPVGRPAPATASPVERAAARARVVEGDADGELRLRRQPGRQLGARDAQARRGDGVRERRRAVARGGRSATVGDRSPWRRGAIRRRRDARSAPDGRASRPTPPRSRASAGGRCLRAGLRSPLGRAPAGHERRRHRVVGGRPRAAARPARGASSPSTSGSRSTSDRNSYSRKSRMTSARS